MERPMRLGFLASRNGTVMQAIIGEINSQNLSASARVIISNNSKSPALEFARKHHIPRFHISRVTSENPDAEIAKTLERLGIDLVFLSGYMRPLGAEVYNRFPTLNIHGADTKKYGGTGMFGDTVIDAVLSSGDKYLIPTLHVVESDTIDEGRILSQGKVEILPGETKDSLRKRGQEEEIRMCIGALHDIQSGKIVLK